MAAGGGGSWKVAYADFTTAMMALFMVLWLTSQDQKIKEAVERSFKQPFHSFDTKSSGLMPNESVQQVKGTGNYDSTDAIELLMLRKMNSDLLNMLEEDPAISANKDAFDLKLTPDGVRLTIFNRPQKPIFQQDTAKFTPAGAMLIGNLAYTVDKYRNFGLEIEGHTNVQLDLKGRPFDSWKLSVDRASVTREEFIRLKVPRGNITKVSGFGDSRPLEYYPPESEFQNRVDIMIRVLKS
jgi:chemotaxis protein MotB